MKTTLILSMCACMIGCAFDPSSAPDITSNMQPSDTNGGNYNAPSSGNPGTACSAKSVFIINTPEGIVVVEVPAFCNPSMIPNAGDPAPDYVSNPNPVEGIAIKNVRTR